MHKTMLDILYDKLIPGLVITNVKESGIKYIITFQFDGYLIKAELPKTCVPGAEIETANKTIITAMSTIYINMGNFIKAKEWMDKLTNESE